MTSIVRANVASCSSVSSSVSTCPAPVSYPLFEDESQNMNILATSAPPLTQTSIPLFYSSDSSTVSSTFSTSPAVSSSYQFLASSSNQGLTNDLDSIKLESLPSSISLVSSISQLDKNNYEHQTNTDKSYRKANNGHDGFCSVERSHCEDLVRHSKNNIEVKKEQIVKSESKVKLEKTMEDAEGNSACAIGVSYNKSYDHVNASAVKDTNFLSSVSAMSNGSVSHELKGSNVVNESDKLEQNKKQLVFNKIVERSDTSSPGAHKRKLSAFFNIFVTEPETENTNECDDKRKKTKGNNSCSNRQHSCEHNENNDKLIHYNEKIEQPISVNGQLPKTEIEENSTHAPESSSEIKILNDIIFDCTHEVEAQNKNEKEPVSQKKSSDLSNVRDILHVSDDLKGICDDTSQAESKSIIKNDDSLKKSPRTPNLFGYRRRGRGGRSAAYNHRNSSRCAPDDLEEEPDNEKDKSRGEDKGRQTKEKDTNSRDEITELSSSSPSFFSTKNSSPSPVASSPSNSLCNRDNSLIVANEGPLISLSSSGFMNNLTIDGTRGQRWSSERELRLWEMYTGKQAYDKIAEELGTTKNAVVEKIKRMRRAMKDKDKRYEWLRQLVRSFSEENTEMSAVNENEKEELRNSPASSSLLSPIKAKNQSDECISSISTSSASSASSFIFTSSMSLTNSSSLAFQTSACTSASPVTVPSCIASIAEDDEITQLMSRNQHYPVGWGIFEPLAVVNGSNGYHKEVWVNEIVGGIKRQVYKMCHKQTWIAQFTRPSDRRVVTRTFNINILGHDKARADAYNMMPWETGDPDLKKRQAKAEKRESFEPEDFESGNALKRINEILNSSYDYQTFNCQNSDKYAAAAAANVTAGGNSSGSNWKRKRSENVQVSLLEASDLFDYENQDSQLLNTNSNAEFFFPSFSSSSAISSTSGIPSFTIPACTNSSDVSSSISCSSINSRFINPASFSDAHVQSSLHPSQLSYTMYVHLMPNINCTDVNGETKSKADPDDIDNSNTNPAASLSSTSASSGFSCGRMSLSDEPAKDADHLSTNHTSNRVQHASTMDDNEMESCKNGLLSCSQKSADSTKSVRCERHICKPLQGIGTYDRNKSQKLVDLLNVTSGPKEGVARLSELFRLSARKYMEEWRSKSSEYKCCNLKNSNGQLCQSNIPIVLNSSEAFAALGKIEIEGENENIKGEDDFTEDPLHPGASSRFSIPPPPTSSPARLFCYFCNTRENREVMGDEGYKRILNIIFPDPYVYKRNAFSSIVELMQQKNQLEDSMLVTRVLSSLAVREYNEYYSKQDNISNHFHATELSHCSSRTNSESLQNLSALSESFSSSSPDTASFFIDTTSILSREKNESRAIAPKTDGAVLSIIHSSVITSNSQPIPDGRSSLGKGYKDIEQEEKDKHVLININDDQIQNRNVSFVKDVSSTVQIQGNENNELSSSYGTSTKTQIRNDCVNRDFARRNGNNDTNEHGGDNDAFECTHKDKANSLPPSVQTLINDEIENRFPLNIAFVDTTTVGNRCDNVMENSLSEQVDKCKEGKTEKVRENGEETNYGKHVQIAMDDAPTLIKRLLMTSKAINRGNSTTDTIYGAKESSTSTSQPTTAEILKVLVWLLKKNAAPEDITKKEDRNSTEAKTKKNSVSSSSLPFFMNSSSVSQSSSFSDVMSAEDLLFCDHSNIPVNACQSQWLLLYTTAAYAPENPTPSEQASLKVFYDNFPDQCEDKDHFYCFTDSVQKIPSRYEELLKRWRYTDNYL